VTLSFEQRSARQSVVYSMDLKISFSAKQSLTLYDYYFIRDNKLYLLPKFILEHEKVIQYLHAFDIRVNDQNIERNWGSLFDVSTGPLIPRYQYQTALNSFDRVLKSNLTIKEIVDGIKIATEWKNFKIEDIKSPNLSIGKRRLYNQFYLSPAKFIATLPESVIKDKMRLNLMLSLLDEAKQSQTNYSLFFSIERDDVVEPFDTDHKTISMKTRDLTSAGDKSTNFLRMNVVEHFLYDIMRYDVSYYDFDYHRYEDDCEYDRYIASVKLPVRDVFAVGETDAAKTSITIKQKETLFLDNVAAATYDDVLIYDVDMHFDLFYAPEDFSGGTLMVDNDTDLPLIPQTDRFSIKHYEFPEIPRNFSGEKDGNGIFTFYCRPNTDGTERFELYGSDKERESYELLLSAPNDSSTEKITFVYDANTTGKRYYKVRAVAGDTNSFLTLPIDVQALV
jgi:hypothetical protein